MATVKIKTASVKKAQSDLKNARTALKSFKALHESALAGLKDADQDLNRDNHLFKTNAISKSRLEKTKTTYDQARANVTHTGAQQDAQNSLIRSRDAQLQMAQAEESHAIAQFKLRQAALDKAKIDLHRTVIRSPVNGMVIERAVDVGQTVAARFQTPILFTIAQDLRKMQVEADLDEADIGRIQSGQQVEFAVDAFPRSTFKGTVSQIRKAPKNVQNVVTYTVVISAENPELRLLPGMTANVHIVVAEMADSIMVPNAALRFRPPAELTDAGSETVTKAEASQDAKSSAARRLKLVMERLNMDKDQRAQVWKEYNRVRDKIVTMMYSGAPSSEIATARQKARQEIQATILSLLNPKQKERYRELTASRAANPHTPKRVWVTNSVGKASAVDIIAGINDGSYTRVVSGGLKPGQKVITGIQVSPGGTRKSRWF
jgi:HlyD family secretion protein